MITKPSTLSLTTIVFSLMMLTSCIHPSTLPPDFLQEPINELGFGVIREHEKSTYIFSILVDDLDGNDEKEIVYKTSDLHILNNRWQLTAKCAVGTSGNGVEKVLAADINGDGRKELITAGSLWDSATNWHGRYTLKIFDSECTLMNEFELSSQQGETYGLFFEDLEGDGQKELVVGTYGPIFIIQGDHMTSFQDYETYKDRIYSPAVGFELAFLVTDLKNDSHKELAILGFSGLSLIDTQANLLWLFHAKKNHYFQFIHIADVHGDPSKEILLSDHGDRTTVLDADGNLLVELNAKNGPIFVTDLDHDERQEIVIGPTIYDSDFNVKQKLPIASSEMQIDDLDNNGNQEIIVFSRKSNAYVSSTWIYVMNAMGELLWNYEYPTWINSYAIEDLDNDGYKEILVAGHHTSPITVFGKQ